MKLGTFLKDKIIFIFSQALIIFFIGTLLSVFKIGEFSIILICLTIIFITSLSLIYEYIKKSRYYNRLYHTLENLKEKQYIAQMLQEPDFAEAEVLYDVLKQATKSMNDEISFYTIAQQEYQEYVEAWIHEIKLPISCAELICQNNKTKVTNSILEEIRRIDSFVEQALFYARSTNVEKDYSIREIALDTLVKSAIKKHSKQLIACKTELNFEGLEHVVYCDPKWLNFILGQIISNSIKYKKDFLSLFFKVQEDNLKIMLSITDNGIGISKKDISRVFEKGFTGEHGREFAKSTGIGLYLCKKLCDKMHIGFEIESTPNCGTTIKIIFPKDKSLLFQ